MAYGVNQTSFDPVNAFGFDPNNNAPNNAPSPFGVNDTPYTATCADSSFVRDTYRQQVVEYANLYGQTVVYQPAKYNYKTANFLYGEDPTSGFHAGRELKAVIKFSDYSSFLSKFGYMSDVDLTIYIPIAEFERVWGPSMAEVFPLAGDIFLIKNISCDRPLKQTPMVFEVTDKHDSLKAVDFMGGHYFWKIIAKRFNYSYEPKAPEERYLDEESQDSGKDVGRQPGGANPPDLSRSPWDVDKDAKEEFDNSKNNDGLGNNPYGKYL